MWPQGPYGFNDLCGIYGWLNVNIDWVHHKNNNNLGFTVLSVPVNICRTPARLLGVQVALQNALFRYFTDTLAAIEEMAKKTGKYDLGILGEWRGGGGESGELVGGGEGGLVFSAIQLYGFSPI